MLEKVCFVYRGGSQETQKTISPDLVPSDEEQVPIEYV